MSEEFVPGTTSSSAPPVVKDSAEVAQSLAQKEGLQKELLAAQEELYEADAQIVSAEKSKSDGHAKKAAAEANIKKLHERISKIHLASR
jgi:hypothetical protein